MSLENLLPYPYLFWLKNLKELNFSLDGLVWNFASIEELEKDTKVNNEKCLYIKQLSLYGKVHKEFNTPIRINNGEIFTIEDFQECLCIANQVDGDLMFVDPYDNSFWIYYHNEGRVSCIANDIERFFALIGISYFCLIENMDITDLCKTIKAFSGYLQGELFLK